MRLLLVLLTLLLAGGLWLLLSEGEDGGAVRSKDPAQAELEDPENLHLTRGREILTIWVKAGDRSVPQGAEVGIRHLDRTRWLYADDRGRRSFTDAPSGTVVALARAPGYAEGRQLVVIEAGVPTETILVLRPLPPGGPDGR